MIYKVSIEDKINKYTFTGRHIYCYIHLLAETNETMKLINQIILYYNNSYYLEAVQTLFSKGHKNHNEIIAAIDKMMNREEVIYIEPISITSEKSSLINKLYVEQSEKEKQQVPPIAILEP